MTSNYTPRPPLLPWSASTWSTRWSSQGRLSTTPIARTPFLLLKAPASTLYEEKFGGDRNMFTVNMYCSRMNARGIRIGLVVDCTALDLEEFEPLPETTSTSNTAPPRSKLYSAKKKKNPLDRRVRYFHNPSEWDDFDVEYHRLIPPKAVEIENEEENEDQPLASQILPQFFQVITKFIQKSRSSVDTSNSTMYISLFDSRGGLGAASYLAAAYMCHTMKAPVHAALDAVKEGSPSQPSALDSDMKWGLCDVRLVKDLQKRYKGNREIVIEGGVPTWWYAMEDDEEDDDDEEKESLNVTNDSLEQNSLKRKRNERVVIPPCVEAADESNGLKRPRAQLYPNPPREILEPVAFDSTKATRAMTVLAQLTQMPLPITKLPIKPDVDISSTTSIEGDTSNIIHDIKSNIDGYKATWLSTKGRRGLLLILSEAVYFIEQSQNERNGTLGSISVSVVTNIKFPSPKDAQKQQHRSLLDVVLVYDIEKNTQCFRFYILDILCIEGGMVWHKPWKERWRFVNDAVLLPRKKEETRQLQASSSGHVYAKELIRIRAKDYFPLHKLEFVMKDVCAGVGHEAKGIRIIPMGAYGLGNIDPEILKETSAAVWKQGDTSNKQQLLSFLMK